MLSCALELNCNVHTLDEIAKKCTNILKSYDAEMAIKVIHLVEIAVL